MLYSVKSTTALVYSPVCGAGCYLRDVCRFVDIRLHKQPCICGLEIKSLKVDTQCLSLTCLCHLGEEYETLQQLF